MTPYIYSYSLEFPKIYFHRSLRYINRSINKNKEKFSHRDVHVLSSYKCFQKLKKIFFLLAKIIIRIFNGLIFMSYWNFLRQGKAWFPSWMSTNYTQTYIKIILQKDQISLFECYINFWLLYYRYLEHVDRLHFMKRRARFCFSKGSISDMR